MSVVFASLPSFGALTANQNGIRRTSGPRVSTTKPVTSLGLVPAVAVTESVAGTVTVGTTASVPLPCWISVVTAQSPVPPPASVSSTLRVALAPGASRPNERPVGAAKIKGTSARGRSTSPPPSRVASTSAPVGECTGSPLCSSADLSCTTVHVGCRSLRSAAAPATWGAAMLVPLSSPKVPCFAGTDERIDTPGALTSGFSCSDMGVGPADEKLAITLRESAAATVIALGAEPGDDTDP